MDDIIKKNICILELNIPYGLNFVNKLNKPKIGYSRKLNCGLKVTIRGKRLSDQIVGLKRVGEVRIRMD